MAAKAGGDNDQNGIVEINVIPLVDIILVVLIIFMVAAPLVMQPKIDINLPKASSAKEEHDKKSMRVVLGKQGEV
ncbi:MAG TPA: biopolymer transporter ExbD, partial [Bdellovibrionales bacterium]|nr:biopolymer transporter ExbD [Bdellovibrionales bacterium]